MRATRRQNTYKSILILDRSHFKWFRWPRRGLRSFLLFAWLAYRTLGSLGSLSKFDCFRRIWRLIDSRAVNAACPKVRVFQVCSLSLGTGHDSDCLELSFFNELPKRWR